MNKFKWLAAAMAAFIVVLLGSLFFFSKDTHYVPLGMSAKVAVVDYEISDPYDGIEMAVIIPDTSIEYDNVMKIELYDNIDYAKIYYKNEDKIETVWVKDPYNRLYVLYEAENYRYNIWSSAYRDIYGITAVWN